MKEEIAFKHLRITIGGTGATHCARVKPKTEITGVAPSPNTVLTESAMLSYKGRSTTNE